VDGYNSLCCTTESMPDLRFDGEVAIVTGAGRGLGRAYAHLLAERGAAVVVNNRTAEKADEVVAEIVAKGGKACADYHNVYTHGERIVQTAISNFGAVHILINNAGQLRDRSFKNMTTAEFEDVINTHVVGSFKVTKAAWPHMTKQRYGRLVFISSLSGLLGNFGQANYSAAKGALLGLGQTLAIEGWKSNILSNVICTEGVTRMNEKLIPQELHEKLRPEYSANAVVYLCHRSCESSAGVYQSEGGKIIKLRWQASHGLRYDASQHGLDFVAGHWDETFEFGHRPQYIGDQKHASVMPRQSKL